MEAGFYKLENGQLIYGPTFISGPGFEIFANDKDNHTYPINGFYWFDTLEEACNHFGLDITNYRPQEDIINP
jgi:hypothetical protein